MSIDLVMMIDQREIAQMNIGLVMIDQMEIA